MQPPVYPNNPEKQEEKTGRNKVPQKVEHKNEWPCIDEGFRFHD